MPPALRRRWDLRSTCDLLEHKRLLARAVALSVPHELCTVALAAYRWERRLLVDTLASAPLWATRGIVPGCPIACMWATITFVEGMRDVVASQSLRWSGLRVSIHVDDVAASRVGTTRGAVSEALCDAMGDIGALVDV